MMIKKSQIDELFEWQKSKPLLITEDNLSDIQLMIKLAKSKTIIEVGDEIFKFFTKTNGKFKINYVVGFSQLNTILKLNEERYEKVIANGGIPIFVEG